MSRRPRARNLLKVPATATIPKDWSPMAAQAIEDEFSRVFRVLADHVTQQNAGLANGIADLTPALGDLIVGGAPAGQFELLAIDPTVQRALVNDGGFPGWGQVSLTAGVTGILPATSGGTGHAVYAVGDLLYASTTTALSRLADVATGNALISGGVNTAPSWGKIGLTTHVSGILPLANGGTGAALVDPGADRGLFWDDSAGTVDWLIFGSGLTLTDKTLTATAGITGPGSSTDEAIVRWDGTGGTTVQDSNATITNAGIATFVNTLYFGADPSSSLIGRGEWTSAPNTSLSTGEWELSLYDNAQSTGVRTVPAMRLRYNDNGTEWTTELPISGTLDQMNKQWVGYAVGISAGGVSAITTFGAWLDPGVQTASSAVLATAASGRYFLLTSAATTGSSAGFTSTSKAVFERQMNPIFECVIIVGSATTNLRYWIGMTSATFTNTDTQSPSKHLAAFRYSTVAGDAGWMPVCGDASNQTVGTMVQAFVASNRIYFKIRLVDGSGAFFSINNGTEINVTATQPGQTQQMGTDVRVFTTANSAVAYNFQRMIVSFGV